ncbi:MAG TPA: hypothetical protein VFG87_28790 [Amycolatopsis sp.]|nr:hypothetical protein [Amycolatopsis sp.]
MTRSVTVKLKSDVGEYIPPVGAATGVTEKFDDKVKETNRDLDKVPPASARAAAAMKLLGAEAGKTRLELNDIGPGATNSLDLVDKKLEETRANVRKFANDFNQTGSIDSFNLWQRATKDLGDLDRFKKKLSTALADVEKATGDSGEQSGRSFTGKFIDVFGKGSSLMVQGLSKLPWAGAVFEPIAQAFKSMPPELQIAIAAGIAAAIVGSAAAIGAALNGVLLSTAGFGGIGLIVAGQLQSPIVRASVVQLGHDLMGALSSVTAPFAGRIGAGVGVIDTGLKNLLSALGPSLQTLSNAINPLAQGFAKFFMALGPGLSRAFQAAAPILLVLAAKLPSIGRALSDMFGDMGSGSRGAAEGLQFLILGLNATIRFVGETIKVLSAMFQFFVAFADDMGGIMQKAFGWIPGLGDLIKKNHQIFHDIRGGVDATGQSVDNLTSAFGGLAPELGQSATLAQQAATAFQNLSKGLDAAFNRTMGVDQATLQLNQSMLALSDSVKQNGTSLKDNTKEGQANLGVIQQSISDINSLRDANIANGDSIDTANGKYQAQLDQLQQTLIKLGFNKDAIKAMIDQYRQIPGQVSTVVNVLGLDAATDKLVSVKQKLDDLNGKITTSYVVLDTVTGQTSTITHKQGYNRWGGIYEHADMGLLNAGIYSTASPARYAFAEPQTGGEAFVPRFGDYGRSMGILDQAARWYGARVMPAGGGSFGGTITVVLSGGDAATRAVMQNIRAEVHSSFGGDVQLAMGN